MSAITRLRSRRGPVASALAALTLPLVGVVGLVGLAGPAAAASGGCSGSLIDQYPMYLNRAKIGSIDLYYNSATGRNCALTERLGSARGHSDYTAVALSRCSKIGSQLCTEVKPVAADGGNYAYYAGPVSVYAPHDCIRVTGQIEVGDNIVELTRSGVHCGTQTT